MIWGGTWPGRVDENMAWCEMREDAVTQTALGIKSLVISSAVESSGPFALSSINGKVFSSVYLMGPLRSPGCIVPDLLSQRCVYFLLLEIQDI